MKLCKNYTQWGFITPSGKLIEGQKSCHKTHEQLAQSLGFSSECVMLQNGHISFELMRHVGIDIGFRVSLVKYPKKVLQNLLTFLSQYPDAFVAVETNDSTETKQRFEKIYENQWGPVSDLVAAVQTYL